MPFAALLGILIAVGSPSQQTVARSDNGRFALELFRTEMRLQDLKAGETRWTIPNPQDAYPANARITDDGRRVALEGYRQRGRHGDEGGNGLLVVILGEDGRTIAAYPSTALFSYVEVLGMAGGVQGGIVALPPSRVYIDSQNRLNVYCHPLPLASPSVEDFGLLFDLETGKELQPSQADLKTMKARAIEGARQRLNSADSDEKYAGISEVRDLEDRASVLALEALARGKDASLAKEATGALCSLAPERALIFLQSYFDGLTGLPDYEWMRMAERAKFRIDGHILERMATSGDPDQISHLLDYLKEVDGSAAKAMARRLLDVPVKGVRGECLSLLIDLSTEQDLSLLKSLLGDEQYASSSYFALKRIKPPDLEDIQRTLMRGDTGLSWDATVDLAYPGDPEAMSRVLRTTRRLCAGETVSGASLISCCLILAEKKPPGALEALDGALALPDEGYGGNIVVRGALAALGRAEHLPYLREAARAKLPVKYAQGWDDLRQARAIGWLGTAKDRASLPLLQELASARQSIIREAARGALEEIQSTRTKR